MNSRVPSGDVEENISDILEPGCLQEGVTGIKQGAMSAQLLAEEGMIGAMKRIQVAMNENGWWMEGSTF